MLGSSLKDGDRVVIIEDVTTSGKSIEETFPIIKAQADIEIKGLVVIIILFLYKLLQPRRLDYFTPYCL